MKYIIILFSENSVEKIQVSLKCDENNWYFARRPMYIYENMSLLRMIHVSGRNCTEIQTHILCFIDFFFENVTVYEIMW